ncbi:MAG: GNAT family N-acetyltransferase [Rhodococcus sp. (in: high G+C Gram-positive bacteria)]|uniref:GNAT family N-acetyltransferase n=1 Tax=Rhodococcus sp. TaxID=1831 RepID=UPI002ADB4EEB|nr:GNAT family N-acetyltransferase [Rhodococcus sp. (in: high G+C Gram-positive bacteria)]
MIMADGLNSKNLTQLLTYGIIAGVLAGVVIGVLIDNIGLGLGFGVMFGVLVSTAYTVLPTTELFWIQVEISAQAHLENWYGRFGFVRVGEQYLEAGIPHVKMLTREKGTVTSKQEPLRH